MPQTCPPPRRRLEYLLEKVGLGPDDYQTIAPHKELFASRAEEFGRHFLEFFLAIDATGLVLRRQSDPQRLAAVLGHWFGALFRQEMSPRFLAEMWQSGVRHVELNLDQRYVNLGYSVARQFCQRIAAEGLPPGARAGVLAVIDKLLDACVLVATDSFITCTSRCDNQVIAGIAHQVRNPVTIIGGNISRLQRQADRDSRDYLAFETVLAENRRLERMLGDIAAYSELYQAEPRPEACPLEPILRQAAERLTEHGQSPRPEQWLAIELDPAHAVAFADRAEMTLMFFHLLENAVQASDPAEPVVRVSSGPGPRPDFLRVSIQNSGKSPDPAQIDTLFQPFTSSRPMGTGFGLPIAALAARRNLGGLSLQPAPQGGALCLVDLPTPEGPATAQ